MFFEDTSFGSFDKAERKARRAYELYENGEMSAALDKLETALEMNPSNSSWHFNKALTLDTINRFDDAIAEYEIALELNPDDLETLTSLAVDYTRTGQYDSALEIFEHVEELNSNFEPCYCNRIITYTEMGQHDLAEQMFYLAQQIEPDCALCYYNIGNNLFVRGDYKKAIHCWQKTAELESTHPQINYRIAQAYWADGDNVLSREHFLAELRANPGDIDVIFDFGFFLLETGEIESAKEKFNRILEFQEDFAPALFYLGEIAFNNNEHEQAIELYNRALQKDNALRGPRYRLAQYALMNGNLQEARLHLVSEVGLASEDANILASIGSMFLAIGDLEYATECLLQAIEIDSSNAEPYYYLGIVGVMTKHFKDALEFFGHALDINPEHVGALRDSAVAYLSTKRTAEALERIKKATALESGDSQLKRLGRRIRLIQATERISNSIGTLKRRLSLRKSSS